LAFGLGELALLPWKFWNLTLTEFDCKCRGYRRKQAESWRRTRLLVTLLVNIHRDPKTPAVTPEALLPLLGDVLEPRAAQATAEEIAALWADLDERDAAILN
jgi:hypothetical protein